MIHKPGIYFGLDEAIYHADESLSCSKIKDLITDPEEFWDQHLNPDPPDHEDTSAMSRGTLWHCRILQPEIWPEKYILAPFLSDDFRREHKGAAVLRTKEDMHGWLDSNRLPYKKSMTKAELEDAIEYFWRLGNGEPEPYLFDRVNAGFEDMHSDKTVIWSEEIYKAMLGAERAMLGHPYFGRVFRGGHAEVSIFWVDESGVPMKRRLDYLPPTGNAIIDYKTFALRRGKPARQGALDAIKFEKYDLDAAVSVIAAAHAVNMINDGTGIIWGDVPGSFIDNFRKMAEKTFGFVFQKEDRPYTVRGLKIIRRPGNLFNIMGNGIATMQQGLNLYNEYMGRFGSSRWYEETGMREVSDHEIYFTS